MRNLKALIKILGIGFLLFSSVSFATELVPIGENSRKRASVYGNPWIGPHAVYDKNGVQIITDSRYTDPEEMEKEYLRIIKKRYKGKEIRFIPTGRGDVHIGVIPSTTEIKIKKKP